MYCENDADTMIARKAIELSESKNGCVVADDTNIFILMLTMISERNYSVYLKQIASCRIINVTTLSFCLPKETIKNLLLHHAFSSFFGHGKTKMSKKKILEANKDLANVFYNSQTKIKEIISAGEKLILFL